VVVASHPDALLGCALAFVAVQHASAALDAGVDDVLVVSGHPLGARVPVVPALCLDAAVEVPMYADRFAEPTPTRSALQLEGMPYTAGDLGLLATDRVLTTLAPATVDGLGVLLATLAAGGSLVLLADGNPATIAASERVTATAGVAVPGVREL
jgi:enamine deaminase RidA (YjgF/YER057c/UK114 family)